VKKLVGCFLSAIVILIGVWVIGSGFRKEPSAFVDDYSLNSDNSIMTVHTGVGSSIGTTRKAVITEDNTGAIKVDFIASFGGINGCIGAKSTYEIPLDANASSISIFQGSSYRLILEKDPVSGEWNPVDWIPASVQ
jgi:hypothetical protein